MNIDSLKIGFSNFIKNRKLVGISFGAIILGVSLIFYSLESSGKKNDEEPKIKSSDTGLGNMLPTTDCTRVETKSEAYITDVNYSDESIETELMDSLKKNNEDPFAFFNEHGKNENVTNEVVKNDNNSNYGNTNNSNFKLKSQESFEKGFVMNEDNNKNVVAQNKTSSSNENNDKVVVENTAPVDNTRKRNISDMNSNMSYGFTSKTMSNSDEIYAVIHNAGKQVLNGKRVTVRITEDCVVKGVKVPKNTLLFGIASGSNERLKLNISSYVVDGKRYYANIKVYDTVDGLEGLYIPGGFMNDVAKEGTQQGINEGQTTIKIPIIGSVTTNALTKKNKDGSVYLKDGHKVFLKVL